MYVPHRLSSAAGAFVLLVGALLASVLLAAPALAAEQVITIKVDGLNPAVLQVQAGDTVSFTVADDNPVGYQLTSTSDTWPKPFDVRVGGLFGPTFTVPEALTAPGTYTYTVSRAEVIFQGSVVLPEPTTSQPPVQPSDAAPQPSGTPAAAPATTSAGGTGTTALPPLTDGFGTIQQQSPLWGGAAPAPTLALPQQPARASGSVPVAAPVPTTGLRTARAVAGDLAGQRTLRGYGLPAALAAVLAAGVLSLLVRLLLAEPAARGVRALTGPSHVATVD